MESNEKTNIEKYIEVLKNDNRSEFQKELFPEDTSVIASKISIELDKAYPILPEKLTFKPNLINKISITIFLTSLTIATGVLFKEIIPVIIFVVFSSIVFFKIWILDPSNHLSFDKSGLYYDDELYKWNEIKSTYTCYTNKSTNDEFNEFYLLIEFENGKITNLDITKISFSNLWKYSNFSDDEIIGHFIEKYKNQVK